MVISLQTELIQPIHVARAVENAVLDFTSLHESSVTNRKDSTRAMDQLCQRIMASMQFQPQNGVNTPQLIIPSHSSMRSSFASVQLSEHSESYDLPPSPPPSLGSPRQPIYQQNYQPNYQLAFPKSSLSVRYSSDSMNQRGRYNTPGALPPGWTSSQAISSSRDIISDNASISTVGEERQNYQSTLDLEPERRIHSSIPQSVPGNDRGSMTLRRARVTSKSIPRYPQEPSPSYQAASNQPSQNPQRDDTLKDIAIRLLHETPRQINRNRLADEALVSPKWSQTTKLRPVNPPCVDHAKSLQRACKAPEVVPTAFEGLYPDFKATNKFPAFPTQSEYNNRLLYLPAGIDNIWLPCERPALHNRYYGFAKVHGRFRKR